MLCKNKAVHVLGYVNLETKVKWDGFYCSPCFVKKLRGMAKVWSKK